MSCSYEDENCPCCSGQDWLSHFNLSIKDYDVPCVMCYECLTDLADQYTDGMHEVLRIMEKHWKDKHAGT